jgi:hypothetical protein
MSEASDPRQAAVRRALNAIAQALLARDIHISEVLAALAAPGDVAEGAAATPRELAAAGRKTHRERVVAEIVRLEQEGRRRAAASIVARQHAADARDPIEVETLTNKFRRWRRAERRAHARLPAPR